MCASHHFLLCLTEHLGVRRVMALELSVLVPLRMDSMARLQHCQGDNERMVFVGFALGKRITTDEVDARQGSRIFVRHIILLTAHRQMAAGPGRQLAGTQLPPDARGAAQGDRNIGRSGSIMRGSPSDRGRQPNFY
jgi:hypothetical protein